jgi:hypothetical protein
MRALAILLLLAGCPNDAKPTSTGATCPDADNPQYTWANFGYDFMCHYCTNCHDSSLKLDQRNGAPLFHDMDTLIGTMDVKVHTDQQAAWGPMAHNNFMPGAGTSGRCPSMLGGSLDEACPEPTDDERTALGTFLACEIQRPQDWTGSDAHVTDHCAAWMASHP